MRHFSQSQHPTCLTLSTVFAIAGLQWVMTRSSINHLIVHTSRASRPVSILPPARYHLLPPRIPQLIARRPSPFFHPDLDPSVGVSTRTQAIHPFSISVHTSPAVRPQPPRSAGSPTPAHPHPRRDITHSDNEALPTGRRGKRHADARFHSSLSNSNGLGECARSSEGENKREGGLREKTERQ